MPEYIKQIHVGSVDYDLNVKAIQDNSGAPKVWQDILNLVQAGFTIEVPWTADDYNSSTAPDAEKKATVPAVTIYYNGGESHTTGTLAASEPEAKKHIYLICHASHEGGDDLFDEYVVSGEGASAVWEKVGNTDIDLSPYALKSQAAEAKTYTTSTPSSDVTGSAGAETITVTGGSLTATGTAEVTYDKVDSATGSSGGTGASANTGEAGAATINGSDFSFTGDTATITSSGDYTPAGTIGGSANISSHSHTVNVSATTSTFVSSVDSATGSAGAHTHDIDTHEHASNQTVILSTGLTTSTFTNWTSIYTATVSTPNYGFTTTVNSAMYNPTVSTLGVLSWSTANAGTTPVITHTAPTGTTMTVVTGIKSGGTVQVAGTPSAVTLTASEAGAHTHTIGSSTSNITYVTAATLSLAGAATVYGSSFSFTGEAATISVSASYQPAGSISGSATIPDHSHSYTKPAAHTHSIGTTPATATGTAEVAVGDHSHTITIASHTHDLSNHTHNVVLTTIPAN